MGKNASAVAAIRELCQLGLAGELLIPALLEALHRVIPSARNLFDWVNADGSIQRYFFEGPIDPEVARLYFEEFYNKREAEAMPRYVDVIRSGATIRSAEELNNRRFFDSALYHEIWCPQRLHYRLEAIVRGAGGKPIGSLVLYREQGEGIFTRADEQLLETLVPYVARGLQRREAQAVEYAAAEGPAALVNLDALGRIVHLSRDAYRMLLLAHGDLTPAAAARVPESADFPTLVLLHRRLMRSADSALAGDAQALTLTNAWGRFEFCAERLRPLAADAPRLIGVTIRHHVPRAVSVQRAIDAAPLSITQKKVCALLLQGLTHAEVAARLGVSPSTAIDHVRKIYLKLDVHNVDELRARLASSPSR